MSEPTESVETPASRIEKSAVPSPFVSPESVPMPPANANINCPAAVNVVTNVAENASFAVVPALASIAERSIRSPIAKSEMRSEAAIVVPEVAC